MINAKRELNDLLVIEPRVFEDSRGYFFESFNFRDLRGLLKVESHFVQDNQSKSSFGTLRGLHFQRGASAQAKLVRVLSGSVLDVVVDLRPESETYLKHFSIELTSENRKQLYVPRGFAHGFVVLSETAEFFYKCDNFYDPAAESGISFNDPDLNIDWKLPRDQLILSDKDKKLPTLKAYLSSQ